MLSLCAPLSPHLHVFTNLEAPKPSPFGFYAGFIMKA